MDWTTEIYFSQLWSLEVQEQGTSMVGFWWRLSSWLEDAHILRVFSHGRKRERDWKQLSGLSLLRNKSHHVYATLMIALNLITCPNSHLQKISLWESGLQRRNLGKEGHNLGHSIRLLQIIQLKIKFPSTWMPLVGSTKAVTSYLHTKLEDLTVKNQNV